MRPFVYFKKSQKFISVLLIICFLTIPLTVLTFPKKAEAVCTPFTIPPIPDLLSVPTHPSPVNTWNWADSLEKSNTWFKTCILDGLAIVIAKTIIKQLTGSIVRWINSGFKGNPSFVQNPGKFFGGIADKIAGNVIENVAPFLCSPFRLNVQLALALSQTAGGNGTGDSLGCTLSDVENNFRNFTSGSGGGWGNWFEITQNPQNNPYGAAMMASAKLNIAIETAQGKQTQQLDWGRGFLSFESCPAQTQVSGTADEVNIPGGGNGTVTFDRNSDVILADATHTIISLKSKNEVASVSSIGFFDNLMGTYNNTASAQNTAAPQNPTQLNQLVGVKNNSYYVAAGATGAAARRVYDASAQPVYGVEAGNNGCITQTPGAVIESQLESTLGSDMRGLEIAQSIDQIVAALVGQLVSQVLGGIGGLAGAGKSNSSGGSSSFDYQNSVNALNGKNAAALIPNLPITGACTPDTQSAQIGDTVTWRAYVPDINGSVTYTWYGEGLSGNASSASTIYSTNGAKTASVIVSSTGVNAQSVQFDCTPINVGNTSTVLNPTISCTASPDSTRLGQPVTWQAIVLGGNAPFSYVWQGDEGLTDTRQSTVKSYASVGIKTASIQVTDAAGTTYNIACSNAVNVTP